MAETPWCSVVFRPRCFPPMNVGVSFEQVGETVLGIPGLQARDPGMGVIARDPIDGLADLRRNPSEFRV